MILYLLLDLPARDSISFLDEVLPRLAGSWGIPDVVQVRAKGAAAGDYVAALGRVREAAREVGERPRIVRGARGLTRERASGRPLVLANDRVDVAIAAAADGVHVGEDDLPPGAVRSMSGVPADFVVGVTCHTAAELERAAASGADYVGLGSFFPSPTKPGPLPDPRVALPALREGYPVPVLAIGGITPERVAELRTFDHLDGVVVSSAVQRSASPDEVLRLLRELLPP